MLDEIKTYRNSCCCICIYKYDGELSIKIHPKTKENVIICDKCYESLQKSK